MAHAVKTPWHLWVVAIFALLWNSMGALDYVMTQSNNEAYLAQFTDAERAFFTGIPTWAVVFWALSIWSAVLASLLLFFRSRFAVTLYWVSLVSFIIVAVQNYLLATPSMFQVVGTFAAIFSCIIFAIVLFLVWYATRQLDGGVLH